MTTLHAARHLRLVETAHPAMHPPAADTSTSYRARRDAMHSVAFVGSQIEAICGVRARDFVRGRFALLDVVHPDDRERVQAGWADDLTRVDYRMVHHGGGVRRVADIRTPCEDDPTAVVGRIEGDPDLDLAGLEAEVDPLTGLANRGVLRARLRSYLAWNRERPDVALLSLDIDALGAFNAARGRDAGDRLLREVAAVLSDGVRPADLVARCDRADFAVVLATGSAADAIRLTRRLVERVHGLGHVTVSAGLATAHPEDHEDDLASRAARACQAARRCGPGGLGIAPFQGGFQGPAA